MVGLLETTIDLHRTTTWFRQNSLDPRSKPRYSPQSDTVSYVPVGGVLVHGVDDGLVNVVLTDEAVDRLHGRARCENHAQRHEGPLDLTKPYGTRFGEMTGSSRTPLNSDDGQTITTTLNRTTM